MGLFDAPEPVLFKLTVDGFETHRGTRGEMLDWVESYYVRRGGYTQAAVNIWTKGNAVIRLERVREDVRTEVNERRDAEPTGAARRAEAGDAEAA